MSSENTFLASPPYKAALSTDEIARFHSTTVALRVNQNKMDQFKQQPEIMVPRIIAANVNKQCFAFSACFSAAPECTGQLALVSVECHGEKDSLKFDIEVYQTEGRLMNLSSKMPVALNVTVLPTMASATTLERIYVCNFIVDVEAPSTPGEVKSETSFAKMVQIMPEISPTVGVRRPRGRPPGKRSSQEGESSESPTASPKKRKHASATVAAAVVDENNSTVTANADDNEAGSAVAEQPPTAPTAMPEKDDDKKRRKLTEALAAPPFNTDPIEHIPRQLSRTNSLSFAAVEQVYMQRQLKLQQKQLLQTAPLPVN